MGVVDKGTFVLLRHTGKERRMAWSSLSDAYHDAGVG